MINNVSDSKQLVELRFQYRRANPGCTATALRLGRYAKEHGIAITDFGGHSTRWIDNYYSGRR